eukprot:TRINITY_DN71257_c0_g1_i1.p1 TRINITY_DN71257_c0_g1~~TRINITY_DN71257_c0_g1_i1.p1  ORF type:complete len:489 (+),score=102.11 TRINITY_DN71257_c0_g1_i1:66-1532(+)
MAPSTLRYVSTRGAGSFSFEEATFEGLAPDGGLLVPTEVPDVSGCWKQWRKLKFHELAYEIASLYIGDEVPADDLRKLMYNSYKTFNHENVVPAVKVDDFYVMELFHGPTFAFKDVALQALGNLYEYFLARKKRRLTVIGATSGDTGSAAIYGLRGKKGIECFILFPEGRVSPIQQQQMTSVLDSNVHCIAVKGTFDDCQDIVKELFGDLDFKKAYGLGAVNSINWARIMFQITYYFWTYFQLFPECDGEMSFSVPTGNFGDVLAGYYAKRMGLPVRNLVVATNSNDILHRFFTKGAYDKHPVEQTSSPSMDIGISSNFERYLYYLFGSNPKQLAEAMANFKSSGKLHVNSSMLKRACGDFLSSCATEKQVKEAIQHYDSKLGYLLDPHTACGVSAIDQLRKSSGWDRRSKHAMVVLGTAHPAKFGDAVCDATGRQPELPPALARAKTARTRMRKMPNSAQGIKALVEKTVACRSSCFAGIVQRICQR